MRYAMGRNSYIGPVVQQWIISHWKSFDKRTKIIIERDLKYFLFQEKEMTVQEKERWEYLYAKISKM